MDVTPRAKSLCRIEKLRDGASEGGGLPLVRIRATGCRNSLPSAASEGVAIFFRADDESAEVDIVALKDSTRRASLRYLRSIVETARKNGIDAMEYLSGKPGQFLAAIGIAFPGWRKSAPDKQKRGQLRLASYEMAASSVARQAFMHRVREFEQSGGNALR